MVKKALADKTKIKVIAFDFGNVLVKDVEVDLENKFGLLKKPLKDQKRYKDYLDLVERGKGSQLKLMQVAKDVWGYPGNAEQIKTSIIQAPENYGMFKLAKALQKIVKVCILTNNKKGWPEKTLKYLGIKLAHVRLFNSANLGVRKPKPGAYRAVLKAYKIKPGELLFIDDKLKNIRGAKALGIKTLTYKKSFRDIIKGLKKFGLAVKI